MKFLKYTLNICLCSFLFSCGNTKTEKKIVTAKESMISKDLVASSEQYRQGSSEWLQILDSAILIDPYNASAYREKSVWLTKTGDYVESFKLLNKAVNLDQSELGYRGWLKLYKLHDYKGAIQDLEHFNSLSKETAHPWGENVFFLTGLARKQLLDYDAAIKDFTMYIDETTKEAGESWVDPYTFIYRGICYSKKGNHEMALADFATALKYCSTCPEVYWQKGLTYFRMSLYEKGCAEIDSAFKYIHYIKTDPYKELFDQPSLELLKAYSDRHCTH